MPHSNLEEEQNVYMKRYINFSFSSRKRIFLFSEYFSFVAPGPGPGATKLFEYKFYTQLENILKFCILRKIDCHKTI